MLLFGDYHTHTVYSKFKHAKGSVLENASIAADKGLKQIAITDHGFGHIAYGLRRREVPQLQEDILNAKEITGVDILLGVEANLVSLDGEIDIMEEDYQFLDILLMGYHRMAHMNTWKDRAMIDWANSMPKIFKPTKERISRNTTAYLKAIDKYPIDVITHLNYGYLTDTLAVAKMAKQKGTLIELNGKRINFTEEEIGMMVAEGVKFIANSDAHRAEDVGEVNKALNVIMKYNIPIAQVANINSLPKFNKKRGI